jgi:hypothetical protein
MATPTPTEFPVTPAFSEGSKRLAMVAMDKGGVGKSFFTILLTQWLESRRQAFLAFDPDYQNSTLTRFVPSAQFLDTRHSENLDRIIEVMNESPLVVVDGVGSQQRIFLDWLEETNLLTLRHSMGLALTLILIVEEDKDTVHQAGEAVSRIGHAADWLVVKNQKNTPGHRIYDNSKARKELLACGAREVTLPKLMDHLVYFLQQQSFTFRQALASNELFLIDRQRTVNYQREVFTQLDSIKEILLP